MAGHTEQSAKFYFEHIRSARKAFRNWLLTNLSDDERLANLNELIIKTVERDTHNRGTKPFISSEITGFDEGIINKKTGILKRVFELKIALDGSKLHKDILIQRAVDHLRDLLIEGGKFDEFKNNTDFYLAIPKDQKLLDFELYNISNRIYEIKLAEEKEKKDIKKEVRIKASISLLFAFIVFILSFFIILTITQLSLFVIILILIFAPNDSWFLRQLEKIIEIISKK